MERTHKIGEFRQRLAQAVEAVAGGNRTKFAEMLGAGDNAKQIGGLWHARGAIPSKYHQAMRERGLSIEYVNDGIGSLFLEDRPAESQPAGLDRSTISFAVRVANIVRDTALEPMSDAKYVEVLTVAIQMASARQDQPSDLTEATREVVARLRKGG